jgi:hypothetical protein
VDPLFGVLSCPVLPACKIILLPVFCIVALTSSCVCADGGHCATVPRVQSPVWRDVVLLAAMLILQTAAMVPCSVLAFLDSLSSAVSCAGISRVYPAVCSLLLVECFPSNNSNHVCQFPIKTSFLRKPMWPHLEYLRLLGSIPGATRVSEKWWVWNGVQPVS